MVQCVVGCSAPHGAVFLPTAGCHVPGVGAAWSDCSPVAHALLLRLEHTREGCGQKFKQKRWWCVFVNNDDTSSHVVLSSLQRLSTPWLRFSVSSRPWGTHVTIFQFVHEGVPSRVQPYTAGSRAGCPRDLGVLVLVRHTSSCRVLSRLCGPCATEAPRLDSSGLTGRAAPPPAADLGTLRNQAHCPGGGPDGFSVWP